MVFVWPKLFYYCRFIKDKSAVISAFNHPIHRMFCGECFILRRIRAIFAAKTTVPTYIHQLKEWPHFKWDENRLAKLLAELHKKQARLLGLMEGIGSRFREEASLQTITLDIVKSSEIEGEILNPGEVRSSVARRLGLETAGLISTSKNIDGVVEMMLDATQQHKLPLTEGRLFSWQAALFPTGRSSLNEIVVGNWRDNPAHHPMQVISGMIGKEKVHFQAPASELLPDEMYAFLKWFNDDHNLDPVTKAAIAHFWFITIHPFDDGNGRIARAITDMQLSRADGTGHRFYSISAQIRKEKNKYYDILENTQKGSLDITLWMEWFYNCLDRALIATDEILEKIFQKARFWETHAGKTFNERQKLMLNKILDGYEGKITSHNWAEIVRSSLDTALRDINDLVQKGILEKGAAGGRSSNYLLSFAKQKL